MPVGHSVPTLPTADEIVVIDPVDSRPRQNPRAGLLDITGKHGSPLCPVGFAMEHCSAGLETIVDDDHAAACKRLVACCQQPRVPRPNDQHVAARVHRGTVGRRLVRGIEPPQPRHGADARFEAMPVRPEKGLVIEAGRQEGRQPVEQAEPVALGRRPRIHGA